MPQNALQAALQRDGPRFNARYAVAARDMPALKPDGFAVFLKELVAPVVDSVAAIAPESVQRVVDALYRVALQTVGHDLPRRLPELRDLWQVFATTPNLIISDATAAAGAATNLLVNIAVSPGVRSGAFIESARRCAPQVESIAQWRPVLTALAWRSGYAVARKPAIAMCRALPHPLAVATLTDHPEAIETIIDLGQALDRLDQNPWLEIEDALRGRKPVPWIHITARAGGFRGFDGPFVRPPVVQWQAGQFAVTDGQSTHFLTVDIYGYSLIRSEGGVSAPKPAAAYGTGPSLAGQSSRAGWTLGIDGRISGASGSVRLPQLASATSWAASETTLVATTALSHRAFVVSLT